MRKKNQDRLITLFLTVPVIVDNFDIHQAYDDEYLLNAIRNGEIHGTVEFNPQFPDWNRNEIESFGDDLLEEMAFDSFEEFLETGLSSYGGNKVCPFGGTDIFDQAVLITRERDQCRKELQELKGEMEQVTKEAYQQGYADGIRDKWRQETEETQFDNPRDLEAMGYKLHKGGGNGSYMVAIRKEPSPYTAIVDLMEIDPQEIHPDTERTGLWLLMTRFHVPEQMRGFGMIGDWLIREVIQLADELGAGVETHVSPIDYRQAPMIIAMLKRYGFEQGEMPGVMIRHPR